MTSPSRPINLHQLTIALILLGVLVHRNQCAPAVEDEDVEGGCYYMFNHYGEGDRILTNEPCLNCTCHNSMLMCYLRVCPFTKPIGQDCVIEKKPDQCCPVITCPQVPVSLVTPSALLTTTSTTTVATVPSSEVAILERGCEMDGKYYPDGAQVASDVSKPCELCYCIRNRTACVMQECILHVEGCSPIFESGVCCPVRYQCDGPLEIETTTPGFGNLISTTISNIFGGVSSTPQPGSGCVRDGEYYVDGSQIPSLEEDPCNHCYCMRGDIVCAVQECGSPLENEGGNCTAVKPRAGLCCPEKYACQTTDSSVMDDEATAQTTEQASVVFLPKLNVSTIASEQTTISALVSSKAPSQQLETTLSTAASASTEEEAQATTLASLVSSTTSPESLSTEATTVHVNVVSTNGEQVEGTTFTPVAQDDEVHVEETSTAFSSSVPSSSSLFTSSTTEQEQTDTTLRPQSDQVVSEKVDTTQSPPVPVVSESRPTQVTVSTTTPGAEEEMMLTTTHESEKELHDDTSVETEAAQPTTIVQSSSTQTVSTATPQSVSEIIDTTTVRIKDEEVVMDDAATTLHPEINVPEHSSSPLVTHEASTTTSSRETTVEQSTESPASDDQGEDVVIHMTTQKPDQAESGTEAPKQDEAVSSSVAPPSSPSQENTEPSTDIVGTTIVDNLISSSSHPPSDIAVTTEKSISTTEREQIGEAETTRIPAQQEPQQDVTSSSVDTAVSNGEQNEIGLTTSAPKVADSETTVTPSEEGQEPGISSDSTEEVSPTTRQPIVTQENVPIKVEAPVSSTTESVTVNPEEAATTAEPTRPEVQSSTQGSADVSEASETTQSPSVEEAQTQSSVGGASEVAASSVATERIVTTTIPEGSNEDYKPEATTTLSSISYPPGVSSDHSASTEGPSSVSHDSTVASQESSTVGPVPIEEKIQDKTNATKPIFDISDNQDHMVIIPEQNTDKEKIPVMPLQRENVTESTTTSSPSSTKVTEETLTTHPAGDTTQEDDSINDIHDDVHQDTTHEDKSTSSASTTEKLVTPIPSSPAPSSETPTERVPESVESVPTTLPPVSQTELVEHQPESVGSTVTPPSNDEPNVVSQFPVTEEPSASVSTEGTTIRPEVATTIPLEPVVVSSTETIEATTAEREIEEATTLPTKISTTSGADHSSSLITETPLADEIEAASASTAAEEVTAVHSSTEGTTSKSVEVSSESQSTAENSVEGSTIASSSLSSVDSEDSSSSSSREPEELSTTTVRHTADDIQETSTSSAEENNFSSTTTEAEDSSLESTPGPVRVPGEGSCFVEGITYQNGSRIPPSTSCQLACACQNSIVHCLLVHCPPAPTDLGDCKPSYKKGICCPTYECGDASVSSPSITVTPEPIDKEVTPSGDVVTITASITTSAASTAHANEKIDENAPAQSDKGHSETTTPSYVSEGQSKVPDVAPSQSEASESSSSTEAAVAGPPEVDGQVSPHPEDTLADDHSEEAPPSETFTVAPGSTKSPQTSNLQTQEVAGGIIHPEPTVEVVATTPETVASSPVQSTNIHTQTEISMVSSSSSSSVSSVASSSSAAAETTNGTVSNEGLSTTEAEQPLSTSESPVTSSSPVEAVENVDHSMSSTITSASPVEVSTSSTGSTIENEVYPIDAGNISTIESTAGSKYPVTTTTSVTPSPAPWPYPSSSTAAPSMSSGACLFDGRVYMSAQQIPRDDPCDFCFCFRGDIICLQQSCPPPIPGCYEEPIPGFCCPRYECPVGSGNTTTTAPLFPPSYYHSQILNNAAQPSSTSGVVAPPNNIATGPGCEIQGEYYETGQVILSTSGPCLECRCGSQGMMECDPRECQPEPMLRKMIAAITSR